MASDNFVNWKAVGIAGVLAIAGAGTYVGVTGHDSAASLRASRSRSVGGGTTTTTGPSTVLTQPALQDQSPTAGPPSAPTPVPAAAAAPAQSPATTTASTATTAPPATAPTLFIPPNVSTADFKSCTSIAGTDGGTVDWQAHVAGGANWAAVNADKTTVLQTVSAGDQAVDILFRTRAPFPAPGNAETLRPTISFVSTLPGDASTVTVQAPPLPVTSPPCSVA